MSLVTNRILLIDDHALFRSGMNQMLRAEIPDVEVREAASLEQVMRDHIEPPSLVLLDIVLQGASGIEGLGLLNRRWPQVPVVMVSSVVDPHIVSQALSHGAVGFVSKAEDVKKMVQVIFQALGKPLPYHANSGLQNSDSNEAIKPRLTTRQHEVVNLLCEGLSNKVMARRMVCSEFTVRGHVQAVFSLMKVNSRSQAIAAAHHCGLCGRYQTSRISA